MMTRNEAIEAGYPVNDIVKAFVNIGGSVSTEYEQYKDYIYIGANLTEGREEDMFFENKEEWEQYKLTNVIS